MLPRMLIMLTTCLLPVSAVQAEATMTAATSCELGYASFRPVRDAKAFELRSIKEADGEIRWELSVAQTGEIFVFRTAASGASPEWSIVSTSNEQGVDPQVRTAVYLGAEDGMDAARGRGIKDLSVLDFARRFYAYRERQGRAGEAGTTPPSGLWKLTHCTGPDRSEPDLRPIGHGTSSILPHLAQRQG